MLASAPDLLSLKEAYLALGGQQTRIARSAGQAGNDRRPCEVAGCARGDPQRNTCAHRARPRACDCSPDCRAVGRLLASGLLSCASEVGTEARTGSSAGDLVRVDGAGVSMDRRVQIVCLLVVRDG